MMDLTALHSERLRTLLLHSREVLTSTVEVVTQRPEVEEAVSRLMKSEDIHEAFLQLAATDPDLMRRVLQATVAALVNVQSAAAIEAELRRRVAFRN